MRESAGPGLSPPDPVRDVAHEQAERRTVMVKPAWSVKMKVLDRPRIVKGVAVVLADGAKGLELTGLKGDTGKKLWSVDYSEKLGIHSAWIGREYKETKDKNGKVVARESDFRQEMMIGLNAENGKTRWKAMGATAFCLPPMGTGNTVLDGGKAYPVRCVIDSGTLKEAEGTKSKLGTITPCRGTEPEGRCSFPAARTERRPRA